MDAGVPPALCGRDGRTHGRTYIAATSVSAQRPANPARFISASELGEYAYCRRAWWLRTVVGVTTATQGTRFEAGRAAHWRHGASLLLARALATAAVLALLGAVLLVFLRRS